MKKQKGEVNHGEERNWPFSVLNAPRFRVYGMQPA
jgi:hypothetical protein